MSTTANPPTPRRCRRILEAHHLDCQGLSPEAIAEQLGCARSTVYAYFRDFQLHRAHILRSVAADRLADQIHILTTPDQEPDRHRQTVASARELRLLLTALPRLQTDDQPGPEDDESGQPYWEMRVDPDGHRRYVGGPNDGECSLGCTKCFYEQIRRPAHDPDEPEIIEPDQDQPAPDPDQSAPSRTNLDKSEHRIEEIPAPDYEFAPIPPNSPPQRPPKPVGRDFPYSKDNPFGYIPPQNVLAEFTYNPNDGRWSPADPSNWR